MPMVRAARAVLAAAATLAAMLATDVAEAQRGRPAMDAGESRYVAVAGGKLHVVTLGPDRAARPPLLLLHGASGNLKDMELSIGRRLAEGRRVILIDRPGHGRSDRLGGREMASPARQADAIAEALRAMGVGRTVVVGHSWSGALATNLALDHPAHVAGLVLLSPATHPWPGGVAWYNSIAATPLIGPLFAATLVQPIGRAAFDRGVESVFAPRPVPPGYVERTEAKLLLRPSEFTANAEDLTALKPFLARQAPRYGAIRVPTTIVTSDEDGVVAPDVHARPLHRQVRGSKLVVLRKASHMPHWTETARVVAGIDALAARAR